MNPYVLALQEIPDDTVFQTYPPRVRRLLFTRNIRTDEEAKIFLNPDWDRDTHDPFLMKDMGAVVSRILSAIEKKEIIALWSDYDMDGIPGAVVLHELFRAVGHTEVLHYTPHRNRDGFGLNKEGIDELHTKGVQCIITIDCGSTDVEQVAHANSKGIDVIITDHHLPPQVLPEAYAILNPKQDDCKYPEKMLSGAGVAFKLVQALLVRLRENEVKQVPAPGWEKWLLDLVGMATLSDMVPLTGENRTFAYFGLVVLKKSRRPGLQALLKKARANQRQLSEDDVAFTIAPRINAASRMGHARDAFTLLSSSDENEAGILSEELERINNERKTAVATMKREIHRKLEKRGTESPVIVLGSPKWKPSLLGLVAGSLAEEYGKPVFLWGREDGPTIKGSCRSEGKTSVYALMERVHERFIEYGGHTYSGGFSLQDDAVHTLEEALKGAFHEVQGEKPLIELLYDDELTLDEVQWDTYREIARLAPFGEGNKKPVFLIRDVPVGSVRMFGKGSEHIELMFQSSGGRDVKAIKFFADKDAFRTVPTEGAKVSLIAHLEASYFLNRPELRLRLLDVF